MLASPAANPLYLLYQLGLDYRPEVIAGSLLAQEVLSLGQLIFQPIGPATRAYAKDTSAPQQLVAPTPTRPYVLLTTPREGLYDQLPPFLFHAIPTDTDTADSETVASRLQQERQIEQETRRFFLPFDTEFYYLRLLRYEQERQADQLADSALLRAEFAAMWPIMKRLEPATASLFIQVVPVIHQLRGNLPWLAQFLAIVFAVPCRFEAGPPLIHQAATAAPALGLARLGINAVLGTTFTDDYDTIALHLGPVPANHAVEFLPASPVHRLLSELLAYFIPATRNVQRYTTIEPTDCLLATDSATCAAPTYLGYNSYLAASPAVFHQAPGSARAVATAYVLATASISLASLATRLKFPWTPSN